MDAVRFLQERARMCNSFSPDCEGCRVDEEKPVISECYRWMFENPERAVKIVEEWSAAHPPKTRQMPPRVLDAGGRVMERLTKRDIDGQAMMDCQKCEADWTGKHGKPMVDCTALYCRNRLKDRLADLESLCSYTRLRELAEADKNGRVAVLPCKVGDRLYEVTGRKTISVYKVRAIRVELFGLFIEWDIVEGFVWQSLSGINAGEIGKTVFLTREEAEKALEAMKNE